MGFCYPIIPDFKILNFGDAKFDLANHCMNGDESAIAAIRSQCDCASLYRERCMNGVRCRCRHWAQSNVHVAGGAWKPSCSKDHLRRAHEHEMCSWWAWDVQLSARMRLRLGGRIVTHGETKNNNNVSLQSLRLNESASVESKASIHRRTMTGPFQISKLAPKELWLVHFKFQNWRQKRKIFLGFGKPILQITTRYGITYYYGRMGIFFQFIQYRESSSSDECNLCDAYLRYM